MLHEAALAFLDETVGPLGPGDLRPLSADARLAFVRERLVRFPNVEADLVAAEDDQQRSSRQLGSAIMTLDERSRDILERRWLADQKSTLQELADEYGVSAERIRQLENNALKKLRNAIAA